MKKKLVLPKFKNEDQERDFWAKIDLGDYYTADDFVPVSFPNLKPTTRPISIRLPEYLLNQVKEKANELVIPYQSLIKQYIQRGVEESGYALREPSTPYGAPLTRKKRKTKAQ